MVGGGLLFRELGRDLGAVRTALAAYATVRRRDAATRPTGNCTHRLPLLSPFTTFEGVLASTGELKSPLLPGLGRPGVSAAFLRFADLSCGVLETKSSSLLTVSRRSRQSRSCACHETYIPKASRLLPSARGVAEGLGRFSVPRIWVFPLDSRSSDS